MSAGSYDITIEQGATFALTITWKNANETLIDLTGFTARLMVRYKIDSDDPFLTLTTENGGITLGGAAGTILLSITAADTSAISQLSGVYDLEMVSSGGQVTRLISGNVAVTREVTR